MFSIFKNDPNEIKITNSSKSGDHECHYFLYKNEQYLCDIKKDSNEKYEIEITTKYGDVGRKEYYIEKRVKKDDPDKLYFKDINIGNSRIFRMRNAKFDEDFFKALQKKGFIDKNYKFNELSIMYPGNYYSDNLKEYDNINLIKTTAFKEEYNFNDYSTIDYYYFKLNKEDYSLSHKYSYKNSAKENNFYISKMDNNDHIVMETVEYHNKYYMEITDRLYNDELKKELIHIINENFNQIFNHNISELNFNNNKMDLSCDYGSYTAEKTNNELKIYYNTYEYVNDVEKDIKQEIYSNKKENIVGTEIEIKKYDPEYFDEELFNVLQSREDIKEFLGFDYRDYNDFKSKAEIMYEQKEKNENELEI